MSMAPAPNRLTRPAVEASRKARRAVWAALALDRMGHQNPEAAAVATVVAPVVAPVAAEVDGLNPVT